MLFVSHSFSFASTTYGLQLTPRGFWSSSQETPLSIFWLAPSSLFAWLMRFPSSLTTWPRWSSPKTAWLCWRDWGPWGFSVSLYCWCPGLASPHLAPDGHLLRESGGGEGDPLRPCWDWSEVQMEVRRQPCVLATGEMQDDVGSGDPWENKVCPLATFEQSPYFSDCCESHTLKKRQMPNREGVTPLTAKSKLWERSLKNTHTQKQWNVYNIWFQDFGNAESKKT